MTMKLPTDWLIRKTIVVIRLYPFALFIAVVCIGFLFGLGPVLASNGADDANEDDPIWTVIYDIPLPIDATTTSKELQEGKQKLQKDLAANNQDHAYETVVVSRDLNSATGPAYQISMQGKGIEPLRRAIYNDLKSIVPPLGGAIMVQISGSVDKDEQVNLELEANSSTGYIWQVLQMDLRILQPAGDTYFVTRSSSIGSPQKQVIPLKAKESGPTTLLLVYRRSFEPQESIYRRILISGKHIRDFADLSDPAPVIESFVEPAETTVVPHDIPTVEGALPSYFDWRDQNKVTPVRNQHSCGSCWAFATVATMEGAMLVQGNGPNVDLSEQFLISCNLSGWSCNGGWRAHPYHQSTLGKNQTKAGAVLEADFPYINEDGTCDKAYNHPYQIYSWSYIDGYKIPSIDAIKQAIYTYGPVTVSVCTGPAFSAYRGGIFATDESANCGSYLTNHAVVLVGWNDAEDTWIMKNSWGTWWGESGYMRIKRNVSNIGYAATYVVYTNTIPAAPKQISPKGIINTTTPAFVWYKVPGATAYQIQIDSLTNEGGVDYSSTLGWYNAADVCDPDGTTCRITSPSALPFGLHEWMIKLRDSKGVESMWSSIMQFEISRVPKQVSPKGDIFTTKPTFVWNKVSGATEYKLQVNDANGVRVFLSWLSADITCKETSSTCRYTPNLNLPIGISKWYVKSRDAALVESIWSDAMLFTVRSTKPILISPSGTSDSFLPTYTWSHVVDATSYIFRLSLLDPPTLLYKRQYTLAELGCANKEVYCSVTPDYLLSGNWNTYYWKVEARGSTTTTPQSDIFYFNTPPAPDKVTLQSPSGEILNWTPMFEWLPSSSPGVNSYEFYMGKKDGDAFIVLHRAWYSVSDICNEEICSLNPNLTLKEGTYTWWVRARNLSGKGKWSDPMQFSLPSSPSKPTLLSPSGVIDTWKPEYQWEYRPGEGITQYQLYIVANQPSGNIVLHQVWYSVSSICSETVCSITPNVQLGGQTYTWWVRARNPSGKGKWSDPMIIQTPPVPGKPTLLAPSGSISMNKPEYSWVYKTDEGITQYMLYIVEKQPSGDLVIHEAWYPVTNICTGEICKVTPDLSLGSSTYTWWVRGRNPSGKGKWSDPFVFITP